MFGSLSANDEEIRKRLIETPPLVDTVVSALQDAQVSGGSIPAQGIFEFTQLSYIEIFM